MNRKTRRAGGEQRRVGGRHLPPNDQVIGRTETAKILGRSKSTTWRMQDRGELTEVLNVDGASWFDRATVLQLALKKKKLALEKKKLALEKKKLALEKKKLALEKKETLAQRPVSGIPAAAKEPARGPRSARPARKPLAPVPDLPVGGRLRSGR